jgi:tRNA-Thr(GGU) m(6)t(6)A37 methyltransferase TsaA
VSAPAAQAGPGAGDPGGQDAGHGLVCSVRPVGVISTPYGRTSECPRWPWTQSAISRATLYEPFFAAADGLRAGMRVYLLWWADQADRSVLTRRPAAGHPVQGVFISRGPDRPNPIGLTLAVIVAVDLPELLVRGADCVDGTPLLDLKPAFTADGTLWQ